MSQSSTASDLVRPPRRSTRIDHAVPLTVTGVDSSRGPYREQVSTVSISAHGCKYESRNQVLKNSLVILELNGHKPNSSPVSAHGHVKWVKLLPDTSGLAQIGIELDDPGNIWGVDAPPQDWLPFCGARTVTTDTAKPKPFAVKWPEQPAVAAPEKTGKDALTHEAEPPLPFPIAARLVGQLMGDFQQQMDKMLSEAAAAAVRERASSALQEVRVSLQAEARRVLAESTAKQAGPWVEQLLKQMKQAGQEGARALHNEWSKTIEADLAKALARIEARHQEFEQHAQSVVERVQKALENSRKDSVDRIISRLKEQMAPVLSQAQKASAELAKHKQEAEGILDQSFEKSSKRLEEAGAQFEKQLEKTAREQFVAAQEQLERAGKITTVAAINNLGALSQKQEAETQARLEQALESIADSTLDAFRQGAAEASHQFASELKHYSRSHLEFVSGAISEVAKGLGKLSKE